MTCTPPSFRSGLRSAEGARGWHLWCAWLLLASAAAPAWALRPVHVYEATVRGVEPSAVPAQAMREVLVRATGKRDAAEDPALAPLIAQAARYVQSSHPSDDATQVVFDGAALERDILAAGRTLWDPERPFTIVVLDPPLTGATAEGARRTLEDVAESRGLPATLVPMPLTDASGAPIGNDALLQNAQHLGGDAVLLGRGAGALAGSWQWTLLTGFSSDSWSGGFDAGVNGAADALVRMGGGGASMAEADALVQVSGVATLADYATVDRILSDLPGVRQSGLEQSDGTVATFRVVIRGGADAIARALAHASRLTATGSDTAHLAYALHP